MEAPPKAREQPVNKEGAIEEHYHFDSQHPFGSHCLFDDQYPSEKKCGPEKRYPTGGPIKAHDEAKIVPGFYPRDTKRPEDDLSDHSTQPRMPNPHPSIDGILQPALRPMQCSLKDEAVELHFSPNEQ